MCVCVRVLMCISDSMILATLVTSSHQVNDSNLDSFGFWMFYDVLWMRMINQWICMNLCNSRNRSALARWSRRFVHCVRQCVRTGSTAKIWCRWRRRRYDMLRHAATSLHIWHCIAGIAMTSMTWYHDILVAQLNITWWLWQWVLSSPVIYTHSRLHVYCNVSMVPAIDIVGTRQKTVFTAGAKAP